MVEGKLSFLQRQVNETIDGLIAWRRSGEPFFGVQTIFAPLIDQLAQKRGGQESVGKEPTDSREPAKQVYTVRGVIRQRRCFPRGIIRFEKR
jgi:hypothetical protein